MDIGDTCQQADLATNGAFYCTREAGHDGPCAAVPRLPIIGDARRFVPDEHGAAGGWWVDTDANVMMGPLGPDELPPTIDYSSMSMQNMNGRELGQRIVGEMSGRSTHGEHHFFIVVPNDALAGVVVALVDSAWKVCQRSWHVPAGTTLEAWS